MTNNSQIILLCTWQSDYVSTVPVLWVGKERQEKKLSHGNRGGQCKNRSPTAGIWLLPLLYSYMYRMFPSWWFLSSVILSFFSLSCLKWPDFIFLYTKREASSVSCLCAQWSLEEHRKCGASVFVTLPCPWWLLPNNVHLHLPDKEICQKGKIQGMANWSCVNILHQGFS